MLGTPQGNCAIYRLGQCKLTAEIVGDNKTNSEGASSGGFILPNSSMVSAIVGKAQCNATCVLTNATLRCCETAP